MKDYGLQVFRYGVLVHSDGRHRWKGPLGGVYFTGRDRGASRRGPVRAFSEAARRRLAFVSANIGGAFRSLVTLTYHAQVETWEGEPERNRRIVLRSKRDLNRFLCCLRGELGEYLWVQEFQARGVVHYHVLCEREIREERVVVVWCRAIESLENPYALRHGVRVERIADERRARGYLGSYIGKARQKVLPQGVIGAGRWWGRSRGLGLVLLEEVISGEQGDVCTIPEGLRIVRCVRRYLTKRFRRKQRVGGGAFVDWGGELSAQLHAMVARLRAFYGTPKPMLERLDDHGWEVVGKGDGDGRG